jgi:GNAT superfamily N-acetyltransferase
MDDELLPGITVRRPAVGDHPRVHVALDDWWGGFGGEDGLRQRRLLLPRLWFEHFTDTSFVAEAGRAPGSGEAGRAPGSGEAGAGDLAAFLVGFHSPARADTAYIHFVGVNPAHRRVGLAGALYRRFFDQARAAGRTQVRCITTPGNDLSVAFHTAMGFEPTLQRDYDSPGMDRITFSRAL